MHKINNMVRIKQTISSKTLNVLQKSVDMNTYQSNVYLSMVIF